METGSIANSYVPITITPLSLEVAAISIAIMLPLTTFLGYLLGRNRRARILDAGGEVDTSPGSTSLGALLALLGLLLAFSFGNALSLMESRKAGVIAEANALGTAFLRAEFLPEPGRTELRTALFEYSETRIIPHISDMVSEDGARAFIARSLDAQAKLWPITIRATADPVPPAVKTFVAGAINEVLDTHLVRMRNVSVPVTELTQWIVIAAALAALFVLGNRSGLAGRPITWRTFLFSAILFLIMITILDVQKSLQGFITVDQSPLIGTIQDMQRTLQ